MSADSSTPSVPDVEATMERLRSDKKVPAWVREFIAALGASVIVLGTRCEELEREKDKCSSCQETLPQPEWFDDPQSKYRICPSCGQVNPR